MYFDWLPVNLRPFEIISLILRSRRMSLKPRSLFRAYVRWLERALYRAMPAENFRSYPQDGPPTTSEEYWGPIVTRRGARYCVTGSYAAQQYQIFCAMVWLWTNELFFFETCSLIMAMVCAYKTNKAPHPGIICSKFGWNRPSGSGEDFRQCILTIYLEKRMWFFIWTNLHSLYPEMRCAQFA